MVKQNWDTEELIENWTLLPQELELTKKKVGSNQIGFALLLKHFQLFAYFPEDKSSISQVVISYIASQVNLPESDYSDYDWQGRSAKVYRVEIRRLFNFKVASVQDSEEMVTWLIDEILPDEQKNEAIREFVYQRFRELQLEPPTKPQVERLIKRAIAKYETDFCKLILDKLTPEMTKQIDVLLSTEETEAILKRFSKNPFKHPTYLALMELGRVIKTIFLCQYLDSEAIRREINEGLNVVERWNGVNEFIFYGKGGEFASNRLESQELSVLSLHLLQICLVYVNTLMIQSVLAHKGLVRM